MSRARPIARLPRPPALTAGVFLIFGQVGICIALLQSPAAGWLLTLLLWGLSGCLAVGWLIAVAERGWWLTLIAPLLLVPTFGFPAFFGWLHSLGVLQIGEHWSVIARQAFTVVFGLVSLSGGFSLVSWHITSAERKQAADRAELAIAARVHESLVPAIDTRVGDAHVFARSVPSSAMGGDLVDLLPTDAGPIVVCADVSGHGVGAGVVMAMLKSAARVGAPGVRELPGLVQRLSDAVYQMTDSGMFATGVFAQLRPGGVWAVVNAGHPAAVLARADGSVERVESSGLPLGVLEGEAYHATELRAGAGDTLLVYTDGFSEARRNGAMLGTAGIERVFASCASGELAQIDAQLREHAGGNADDDRSTLLVRLGAAQPLREGGA